jgi:hypothetical protein
VEYAFLNLLMEVLAKQQDACSSGKDSGVLSDDSSSAGSELGWRVWHTSTTCAAENNRVMATSMASLLSRLLDSSLDTSVKGS